jgi:hypothetical protein
LTQPPPLLPVDCREWVRVDAGKENRMLAVWRV